jgi:WD40 repeat protein
MRHFKDNVVDSAFSENNNQLAILGDHYLKIIDAENIQVTITMITLESERGMLDKVCWSSDGQYLTTSSKRYPICTTIFEFC